MLLNGASVKGLSPDRIARMGMVRSFQDVRLFQRLTVLENVAVAVPHQPGEHLLSLFVHPIRVRRGERLARDEALQYLGFVGMAHAASAVAGSLSYAEQKLVAIARAIATRAEVLLLDEPTSGVDPAWVDRIAETIRDLPKLQKTVCIVEHNLSFLEKIGAPCYFLEMGTVTQHGQLRDLMGEERLRKAYFGV
jgi:branched-chain amino acid transport system permease protein